MKIEAHKIPTEVQIEIKELQRPRVYASTGKTRTNNRKCTKGRRLQKVVCMDSSVFPPVITEKFIKHIR